MAERSGIDYFSQAEAPVPHSRTWHTQWIHGPQAPRFDTSTLARAIEEFGRIGIAVAAKQESEKQKLEKAATGRKALRVRTRAARAISELRAGEASDDPMQAPGRFDEGVADIRKRALEEIEDPEERSQAEVYLNSYAAAERRQLAQASLQRAAADTLSALDASYEVNLAAAAGAGSDIERAAAYARHLDDLERAREVGWISEADYAAREQ
ncbi:MAG TPA: hypothetical protein VNK91_06535, partial [Burkholderiaceae bacterium]|nr:hypothetical protein [Burkholderiaceae bacterium]